MAYRFKLEAVLALRRNLEELAQQKLAREELRREELSRRLADLRQERQDMIADFEEKKRSPMTAPIFTFHMEGISRREGDIAAAIAALDRQHQAVEQARAELADRVRDKKGLEKLRERDRQKYLLAQLKKEQNEADEQVVLRFGRQEKI